MSIRTAALPLLLTFAGSHAMTVTLQPPLDQAAPALTYAVRLLHEAADSLGIDAEVTVAVRRSATDRAEAFAFSLRIVSPDGRPHSAAMHSPRKAGGTK